jgi:hypothetical protein
MAIQWTSLTSKDVLERLERLDLPFNQYGMDPYGISKAHLGPFLTLLEGFYRRYFRVHAYGLEHVPDRGAGMLVGNHSGGIPADGGMILASLFLDHEPPRLAHGMVEKFAQEWPFVSQWFSRVGQLPGLPEHAIRLLREGRLLMVFPEGARGLGKLYKDRYNLLRFGTGFMRIALQSKAPVIPHGVHRRRGGHADPLPRQHPRQDRRRPLLAGAPLHRADADAPPLRDPLRRADPLQRAPATRLTT